MLSPRGERKAIASGHPMLMFNVENLVYNVITPLHPATQMQCVNSPA